MRPRWTAKLLEPPNESIGSTTYQFQKLCSGPVVLVHALLVAPWPSPRDRHSPLLVDDDDFCRLRNGIAHGIVQLSVQNGRCQVRSGSRDRELDFFIEEIRCAFSLGALVVTKSEMDLGALRHMHSYSLSIFSLVLQFERSSTISIGFPRMGVTAFAQSLV